MYCSHLCLCASYSKKAERERAKPLENLGTGEANEVGLTARKELLGKAG